MNTLTSETISSNKKNVFVVYVYSPLYPSSELSRIFKFIYIYIQFTGRLDFDKSCIYD